jgi:hypothetical protein
MHQTAEEHQQYTSGQNEVLCGGCSSQIPHPAKDSVLERKLILYLINAIELD